ncbi:hypothetical protein TWF281_001324 [Arthrobotrys megalospora]
MFSFKLIEVLAICAILFSILAPCSGQFPSNGSQPAPGTISNTEICRRWRHSSVVFDKSLYIYGGNAWHQKSEIDTGGSTTNRDFVSLGLSNNFDLTNTPFVGLPIPPQPGPPKVLQGSFWVDEPNSKFSFYGGSFSPDSTVTRLPTNETITEKTEVEPFSLWSYHPPTARWTEEDAIGDPVLRASRGASAYYKGVGYYRGGQLDNFTNPNWPRGDRGTVILSGMLKVDLATSRFTNETRATGYDVFKFQNPQNTGLQYRDGNLVPITFNGKDYLINFAGGGPRGHALELDNVYIYDIERASWYRQPVSGVPPENTRGACAVANSAPDGSSIQIIIYGGLIYNQAIEDFEPAEAMWILSIPGFKWIPVKTGTTNLPTGPGPRQDHTCHVLGSQMLVVGGRNTSSICEGSGIWVFDTAKLEWQTSFTADSSYTVPISVISAIGGSSNGGASWDGLPIISPPDTNSPFYDLGGSRKAAKKSPSAGVIAGSVIGGLVFIGSVGLVIWHFYKRNRRRDLGETPIPPIAGGGSDPPKEVYAGAPQGISELASPTPSSQAPRYSSLSGFEPAQLHGDSSFPVELYSPPLGHGPQGSGGVYEVQSKNNTSTTSERDPITHATLQEAPVPPPARRS